MMPEWKPSRTGRPGPSPRHSRKATRIVRATCSGCGRITDIPWQLLLRPPRITTATFIGNVPLKCQKCGNTEPIIGVQSHGNTRDYASKPG